MMDHYIALIMAGKITRCRKAFYEMPKLWDRAIEEGLDEIFEALFDDRLTPTKAKMKFGQKVGMGTERWKEIGMISKSLKMDIKRKYKSITITISPEMNQIMQDFKIYGGKVSQFFQNAGEKVIEEIGDDAKSIADFVNTWHGHIWRKNLESAEFKRKLEKYHLEGLESKEDIHEIVDKLDRENEIKLQRKLRDAKKKAEEIEKDE